MRNGKLKMGLMIAVGAAMLWLCLAVPALAGPLEDGLAAYERKDYATAVRLLRPLADQGDAVAQNKLGVMYDTGEGVPQDKAQAVAYYRKAAEQGDAAAQLNLGGMYATGRGVPQDDAQAVAWFRKAAGQGYADAQVILGNWYVFGFGVPQDEAQAVAWFRKAAEQGHATAQINLGDWYTTGRGVPQDDAQAMAWWRKAAGQGHAEAVARYRKAAEQGYADAQFNLGFMYANGEGVPQDDVQAHLWSNLAADVLADGDDRKRAVKVRDLVAARMTPAQLAEAQRLAREWKPEVAGSAIPMMEKITIPNISLLYQLYGALILGWALALTPDDRIKERASTYLGQNPHFLNALFEQRCDARFGVTMLVVGYGLQLFENLFTLSNKISPEWTWKLAAAYFIIFFVIHFLTRRRHRYKKVTHLADASSKTPQKPKPDPN